MAISKTKRLAVWTASGGRCAYCGRSLALDEMTVDHIVAKSSFDDKTEADAVGNLCASCHVCNREKASMSKKEFRTVTNSKDNELKRLEAQKRRAERLVRALDTEIRSRRFRYVRYLRERSNH